MATAVKPVAEPSVKTAAKRIFAGEEILSFNQGDDGKVLRLETASCAIRISSKYPQRIVVEPKAERLREWRGCAVGGSLYPIAENACVKVIFSWYGELERIDCSDGGVPADSLYIRRTMGTYYVPIGWYLRREVECLVHETLPEMEREFWHSQSVWKRWWHMRLE